MLLINDQNNNIDSCLAHVVKLRLHSTTFYISRVFLEHKPLLTCWRHLPSKTVSHHLHYRVMWIIILQFSPQSPQTMTKTEPTSTDRKSDGPSTQGWMMDVRMNKEATLKCLNSPGRKWRCSSSAGCVRWSRDVVHVDTGEFDVSFWVMKPIRS